MLFKIAGFPINNLRTNIFSSIFLRGNLLILCILITRSSCAQCTPRQHTKLYIYHIIIIQQFAYIASNATQFCFTADSILVVRFRIGTHTLRAPNPFRCISWANKAKHTHKAFFFVCFFFFYCNSYAYSIRVGCVLLCAAVAGREQVSVSLSSIIMKLIMVIRQNEKKNICLVTVSILTHSGCCRFWSIYSFAHTAHTHTHTSHGDRWNNEVTYAFDTFDCCIFEIRFYWFDNNNQERQTNMGLLLFCIFFFMQGLNLWNTHT